MSKIERSNSQKRGGHRKKRVRQERKPDERVRRTRNRLGNALVELIQEKPINDVTVQDVLDRASVGRSTFYLHYRDKDDLLLSQLESFLEMMSTMLSIRNDQSQRVAPVEELFAHIGNETKLYRVLADSGHLKDFFDLAQGYFSRGIEKRLNESKRLKNIPQDELPVRASALAGSVLSLLRWGSIAARENHHTPWMSSSIVWSGTDSNSPLISTLARLNAVLKAPTGDFRNSGHGPSASFQLPCGKSGSPRPVLSQPIRPCALLRERSSGIPTTPHRRSRGSSQPESGDHAPRTYRPLRPERHVAR